MRVWVDTYSGTYGDLNSLRIVDVPDDILEQWDNGESDSVIANYAQDNGEEVQ